LTSANHRAAVPLVKELVPITIFASYLGHQVLGTDASFWRRRQARGGPALQRGSLPQLANDVVMSASLATALHLSVGDLISVNPLVSTPTGATQVSSQRTLKICGISDDTQLFWDQVILGTSAEAEATIVAATPPAALHPVWKAHVVHYLLADCPASNCQLLSDLINHATIAQMIPVNDSLNRLAALVSQSDQFGLALAILILSLGALAVGGIMIMRAETLLDQLQVLYNLGFTRRSLAALMTTEGLILATVAIAAGAIFDAAVFPWLKSLLAPVTSVTTVLPSMQPSIPLWHSAPVWIVALLATITCVCLPLLWLRRRQYD
jgi:ABC-type lipoprotein release transport system permease subunit